MKAGVPVTIRTGCLPRARFSVTVNLACLVREMSRGLFTCGYWYVVCQNWFTVPSVEIFSGGKKLYWVL